jgi:tetratricopeptide (TPR) repeat protein
MMVERHYDDAALISLMETNRAASDAHLPSCKACSEKLQSMRAIAGSLRDRTVWDTRRLAEEPSRQTIANLRAFADRMADEDTHAERYLRDLLEGPRETWMSKLSAHPEYRTAGVVRKLIAAASRAVDTMPPDAVEMTGLATEIADHLDAATLPSDTVTRLRGQAWRERAYSLFYTGDYGKAVESVQHAEAALSRCGVNEYDVARVLMVKAMVSRALDRFEEASGALFTASTTFALAGDAQRSMSTRLMQALVQYRRGKYAEALEILLELEERAGNDAVLLSHIVANIAECYRELRNFELAFAYLGLAAEIWRDLGNRPEAARVRMNSGIMLSEAGRFEEALVRLVEARSEFSDCGMTAAAAFNEVHIAELQIARGNFDEAEVACRAALDLYSISGATYTARAVTALAYLREAVSSRKATTGLVRQIRSYVSRLPAEPALLFAHPPQ